MERFFVYHLVDPRNNEPFYVGKGTKNRPRIHLLPCSLKGKSRKNSKIKSIRDAGFEVSIVVVCDQLNEADAYELEYHEISKFGRLIDGSGSLTNISAGGPCPSGIPPYKRTDWHRSRLSELAKNRRPSPQQRANQSIRMSGSRNSMFGKKHTETTKKLMREIHRGIHAGPKNIKAKIIQIFDSDDILRYSAHGNFIEICNTNELPMWALSESYKNGGSRIFMKKKPHREEFMKFKGWWACVSPDLESIHQEF